MTDHVDRGLRSLMARVDDMTPVPPAFEDLGLINARTVHERGRRRPHVVWAVAAAVVVSVVAGVVLVSRPDRSTPVVTETPPPPASPSVTNGAVATSEEVAGLWVFATRAVRVDEDRVGTGWPMPSPLPAYRYDAGGTVSGFDGCNQSVATWQLVEDQVQAAAPDATAAATAMRCADDADVDLVTVPPLPHAVTRLGGALTLLHTNTDGSVARGVRVADLPKPGAVAGTTWTLAVEGDDLDVSFRDDGTAEVIADRGPCATGRYTYTDGRLELDLTAPPTGCGGRQLGVLTAGRLQAAIYSDGYASDTLLLASEHGAVRLFPSNPTQPPTTMSATATADALLTVDGCPSILPTDLRPPETANLFGRTTPDGLSIQAVATTSGVEGPYVVVLRYRSETRDPTFGDAVEVNGRDARLYIGPVGQGQLSWVLDDGSEAYVRSRGVTADDLLTVATSLVPRSSGSEVVGFDLAHPVAGMTIVAETTTPFPVSSAATACHPASGADLRVGVIEAPIAAQYAYGLDQSPLPTLQRRGDHLVFAVSHDAATATAALGIEPTDTSAESATTRTDMPTVTFTTNRSALGQPGCTVDACRFVDVTIEGFAPHSTVTITCHSATTGPFGTSDISVGDDGTATDEACYFGYPAERFWVTANGIPSPTITWPSD